MKKVNHDQIDHHAEHHAEHHASSSISILCDLLRF